MTYLLLQGIRFNEYEERGSYPSMDDAIEAAELDIPAAKETAYGAEFVVKDDAGRLVAEINAMGTELLR